MDYRKIIHRELIENRILFLRQGPIRRPITGYSCWALGYIDDSFSLAGCLLHPAINGGVDLRYLVDYGDKCTRETCYEYQVFSHLNEDVKVFYIAMTNGMDSFVYSSRKKNPLFRLLNWGDEILTHLAHESKYTRTRFRSIFEAYPFLMSHINPKVYAYPVKRLMMYGKGLSLMENRHFSDDIIHFMKKLEHHIASSVLKEDSLIPVHMLELEKDFLNLIRLGFGINKITMKTALRIKRLVDHELTRFHDVYSS
jgi:hypothetical protein